MTQEEFEKQFSGGHLGDKLDYKLRLNAIAEFLYRGVSVETISDDKTLTKEDNNKIFLVDTDAKVITLPPTEQGLKFTFINAGADSDVKLDISPDGDDGIFGTIPNAAVDSVASGTDGDDFYNTKDTANKGDRVTLVADGDDGWYITEGVGIWANDSD
jgi:hypothetical protein